MFAHHSFLNVPGPFEAGPVHSPPCSVVMCDTQVHSVYRILRLILRDALKDLDRPIEGALGFHGVPGCALQHSQMIIRKGHISFGLGGDTAGTAVVQASINPDGLFETRERFVGIFSKDQSPKAIKRPGQINLVGYRAPVILRKPLLRLSSPVQAGPRRVK